ncbi:MAG: DNA polymerase/3'-5' exonuclease PolX [Gemmatimonadaceae bacterium]|nr:DNA polymerase/3'-5' exonuclease PolX [Gemmatimonadaceae bacterium]
MATLLELRGETPSRARTLRTAARTVLAHANDEWADVLARLDDDAATVLGEVDGTGDSDRLHLLRETTPEGLLDMLRVPGLGTRRIAEIHAGLGIETLYELDRAASDGRLEALPRFGARAADRIRRGIAFLRESGEPTLFPHARAEAQRLAEAILPVSGVLRVEVAGSLRRRCEVIRDIDVVVVADNPEQVAARLAALRGVRDVVAGDRGSVSLRFTDGTSADVYCVDPAHFAVALWRATGSAEHCADALVAAPHVTLVGNELRDGSNRPISLTDETAVYAALGLSCVEPELREGRGEVASARDRSLPRLVTPNDVRGVLHCHSSYSDGTSTIAELAAAARERGWEYLGITDHSQSSFYAGGLTTEAILRQHEEIDRVNDDYSDFRVLKGIEADILADGRVDYDEGILDRFEYVVASVHSRYGMNETQMTDRVLRALEDRHVTILGHPTGRLLLTREPYAIDVRAIVAAAAREGVAVELNADPHRLDLDWRWLREARDAGTVIEIGPDAHSVDGLDNMEFGIGIARKGWLEATNVLNTRNATDVLSFARRRRTRGSARGDQ